jgi:hypothetical protein
MSHTFKLKLPKVKNIFDISPETFYVANKESYGKFNKHICTFPNIYHFLKDINFKPNPALIVTTSPTSSRKGDEVGWLGMRLELKWLVPDFVFHGDDPVEKIIEGSMHVYVNPSNGGLFQGTFFKHFGQNSVPSTEIIMECTKEFFEGYEQDYQDRMDRLKIQLNAIRDQKFRLRS